MASNLSEKQNFALGTIAAFIESIILQPTLYWKNARAQNLPFTCNIRVIYRGTGASTFNECQMMAVQFASTSFIQKRIAMITTSSYSVASKNDDVISAALGGLASSIFSCPIELTMIQQQAKGGSLFATVRNLLHQPLNNNTYNNTYHPIHIQSHHINSLNTSTTTRQLHHSTKFHHNGPTLSTTPLAEVARNARYVLTRGLLSTAVRDTIYVVGMLAATPRIQHIISTQHPAVSDNAASVCASAIGGVLAAVPSHPFDVIKTCMQGDVQGEKYRSFLQSGSLLLREGGIARLFRGVGWRTVNITLTVYIANECRIRLSDPIARWV